MRNTATIITIFIVIFAITLTALNIGVAIGFNVRSEQYKSQKLAKNDITYISTFGDAIRSAALDTTGLLPIEGYDAYILLRTFPGLTEKDFNNVEALQGTYIYTNGKLEFLREIQIPIHSAEKTISNIGMETLYKNLANRYSIVPIDSLIEAILK